MHQGPLAAIFMHTLPPCTSLLKEPKPARCYDVGFGIARPQQVIVGSGLLTTVSNAFPFKLKYAFIIEDQQQHAVQFLYDFWQLLIAFPMSYRDHLKRASLESGVKCNKSSSISSVSAKRTASIQKQQSSTFNRTICLGSVELHVLPLFPRGCMGQP